MYNILKKYIIQHRKDKIYYGEFYTRLKISDKNQINESSGTEVHLLNIRQNGTYIQPRVMQHCFRVIHYDLNYKEIDFHSLRHTHATLLLSSGVNIKAVQERLGHKKPNITLDVYTHVTDEMRDFTLDVLNKNE